MRLMGSSWKRSTAHAVRMKPRTTILVCWGSFLTIHTLCRLFTDVLPAVLPGLALLAFRLVIPFASERFKRVFLIGFVSANILGIGLLFPVSYFTLLATIGAIGAALVCFIAMVRSDIAVFRRDESIA